jgi:hypothetical protein
MLAGVLESGAHSKQRVVGLYCRVIHHGKAEPVQSLLPPDEVDGRRARTLKRSGNPLCEAWSPCNWAEGGLVLTHPTALPPGENVGWQ